MERRFFSSPFPNTNNGSSNLPSFVDQQDPPVLFPSDPFNFQFSSPPSHHLLQSPQHMVPFPTAPPLSYPFAIQPQPQPHPPMSSVDPFWPPHGIPDPSAAPILLPPQVNNYQYSSSSQNDARWVTKAARNKRKMARQRSILHSGRSSSFGLGVSSAPTSQSETTAGVDDEIKLADDTNIIFSNNKKLKLVFKKELKHSDVSQLGRIVIPKKEAEENLPYLTEKEGIKLVVKDLSSDRHWTLKYKFWSNNKSRMYVLENAGDLLKKTALMMGDTIVLYVDEDQNYFMSAEKTEEWERRAQYKEKSSKNQYSGAYQTLYPGEEEDAALALLIENLKHSDEREEGANSLLTLSMGMSSSYQGKTRCIGEHCNCDQDSRGINHHTLPFLDNWMGDEYHGGAETQGGQSSST